MTSSLAIASDHGGLQLKQAVTQALNAWGIAFEDLGTHDVSSCDYPDYAHQLAEDVTSGRFSLGILICGTGVGMAMAANRHAGVRAAVVSDTYSARMAREHNDANVLCLGQRVVGEGLALDIVRTWLATAADSDPRHVRRVAKIDPSGSAP
jgi:ribose 5-phosphate isomerase B